MKRSFKFVAPIAHSATIKLNPIHTRALFTGISTSWIRGSLAELSRVLGRQSFLFFELRRHGSSFPFQTKETSRIECNSRSDDLGDRESSV
jgi:hypothetical protein